MALPVRNNAQFAWYHYMAVSLVMHAVMLSIGNHWIADPDTTAHLSQPDHTFYHLPKLEIQAYNEIQDIPDPVSEEANPFEEPDDPLEQRPQIHLSMPQSEIEPTAEPAQKEKIPVQVALNKTNEPSQSKIEENNGNPLHEPHEATAEPHSLENTLDVGHLNTGMANNTGAPHSISTAKDGSTDGLKSPKDETSLWEAYKKKLNAHFKSHRHYPEMARRLKLTGTVILSVEINRNGEVFSVRVEQSSGIEILDEAAISSAKEASPAPAFPEGVTAQTQKLLIPYRYYVN